MTMEYEVLDLAGRETAKLETSLFQAETRPDLVSRVFSHQQSKTIQPQGRDPRAGRRASAEFFGTGLGMSRVPRIKEGPLRGTAALVSMARGGRRPHVTTAEKDVAKETNTKEGKLALAAAIGATADRRLVRKRGHRVSRVPHLPLIVTGEVEEIRKTRDFVTLAEILGLDEDIARVKENKKTVGGNPARRGRGTKWRRGPLVVHEHPVGIQLAVRNIPGTDAVRAANLSVHHLAPGGGMGRLALYTAPAVESLSTRLAGREEATT